MALPLILAMTAAEMTAAGNFPDKCAWMACHFSPYSEGITNIPAALPPNSVLILNDRIPCRSHSAGLVASQLSEAVRQLGCESVLLDFQRPEDAESMAMVSSLAASLPCPIAVSERYAAELSCPVFVAPGPLHVPLGDQLARWQGREIWLEAALCQETVTVTPEGTTFSPQFPPEQLEGGFFDETLCCRCQSRISENEVCFTLFDTYESLQRKLELAQSLGVTCAVGLYQEIKPPRFSK